MAQVELPGNPRKRPIDSIASDDGNDRAKKRVQSSDVPLYSGSIPSRAELNRLLGQLTPAQRARNTDIVQAAALRAAKAMKEFVSKGSSVRTDAGGPASDAPEADP